MNWYDERIEWKHNLRAELHHNFVLKKRTFQMLAIFYVRKKTKRVKTTISEIMFDKNIKKRLLRSTFNNWNYFVSFEKAKKFKCVIADQFFKNNLKNERIRPYFVRWTIYVKKQRILKLKMEESFRYYQTKLKSRVFNAFLSYIIHRRLRKNQIERVNQFYCDKLKRKMLNKLVSFKMYKCFRRDKSIFAENFYRKKLLRRAMFSFWKNLQRRLYKKERFDTLARHKNERLKKYYFDYWKLFILHKRSKSEKQLMAIELFESRCKQKYFRKLRLYRLYRRKKFQYQSMKLNQIKNIFDRRLKIICFNNWKYFTHNKRIKKERLHLAQINYESLIKKTCFRSLLHYKNYKRMKKKRNIELDLYHYHKTLQRTFYTWKSFACEKRIFTFKKIESKKYYQRCLVRSTFKLMIKSAFQEKDIKLDNYLENEKRRLIIAQKYIKLWKTKTKNCRIRKSIPTDINYNLSEKRSRGFEQKKDPQVYSFIGSLPENFIWDPICFARPRVPDYLKKYYHNS